MSVSQMIDATPVVAQEEHVPAWQRYAAWHRWGLLSILFLVATANYFDYFILSVLLEPIKHEFNVSDTTLGLLSGVCFALVYSAAALPTARWADRGNRSIVITLALTGWSLMTALCGFAQSFWQLALARFGVGACEPGALPAAQSLVVDYFPPHRRAMALSILSFGGSAAGWVVGIGAGGYLAAAFGWRGAFISAGALSMALALVAKLTLSEPRSLPGYSLGKTGAETIGRTVSWLRRKRTFVWALAGLSLYNVFAIGVMVFIPSFLQRSLHATLEQVSLTWGLIMGMANLAGAAVGGLLADGLSRSDIRWYAWIPALGCAVGLPLYLLALSAKNLWTFIGIEFMGEFAMAVGVPVIFAAVMSVSGAGRRAMASAVIQCTITLVGGNVGPLLVGAVSDAARLSYGAESLRYGLMSVVLFLLPAALAFSKVGRSILQEVED